MTPETSIRRRRQTQAKNREIEREASASRRAAGITKLSGRQTDADWQRLRAFIPEDTRGLTGRMFGDPVFERSALYRKQEGQPR